MKLVLGHQAWSEDAARWHTSLVERARAVGVDVEPFCLVPDPPAPRSNFDDLDRRWRRRDRRLLDLRDRLMATLQGADVFWNFNGAGVHPAWLRDLPALPVYGCFDDPESTDALSRPVARYHPAALVGNIACLPLYRSWGIREVAWAPVGFIGDDYDPSLTPEQVEGEERPIDVIFFGEREAPWRRERLDRLAKAFPTAVFHGRGWNTGYVSDAERRRLYRSARIGWNLHNSVGPINVRMFGLPAAGVLQICDNRCRLAQIYELGREVVGFDELDECIELTRHYLEHEDERRRIAANGLRRYQRDYAEPRLWEYYLGHLSRWHGQWRRGELRAPEQWGRDRSWVFFARRRLARAADATLARLDRQLVRRPPVREEPAPSGAPLAYRENPEVGAANFCEKRARLERGESFEWPDMVALNWAVAARVGDAASIVELGGGTGCFAHEAAAVPGRRVVCADPDAEAIAWAREHRSRPNVEYLAREVTPDDGPFELAVSVDVIEHVADFPGFLGLCTRLAPRLLVTTPNRARGPSAHHAGPPAFAQHVREWTAGELYWVLRCFYREVALYGMPDRHVPWLVPVGVDTRLAQLVADCREPLRSG